MDRSAPNRRLELDWIFGYESEKCRNNIFYNCNDEIVYFIGCVSIVFDTHENRQRFFTQHSHRVTSLCIHPRLVMAASGAHDTIFVWNTLTMAPISQLSSENTTEIIVLAFSSSGNILGSICSDENFTSVVFLWNWSDGRILSSCGAHPSRVLDLSFDPVYENRFVTCGVKHVKFWNLNGNSLNAKFGRFGSIGPIQTLTCVSFGSNDRFVYMGSLIGDIYVWHEFVLMNVVTNAHSGAVICANNFSDGFVTGGKDGVIIVWGSDMSPVVKIDLKRVDGGYENVCVRSIRCSDSRLLVGTARGEIVELSAKGRVIEWIVRGHGPRIIHAMATHPRGPVFATAGDDRTIRLWNYVDKRLVVAASSDSVVQTCDFSFDGFRLAVGCDDGSVEILNTNDLTRIWRNSDRIGPIYVIKFAPNNLYLAVGGENSYDIYHVDKDFRRTVQCTGKIVRIDWSDDSSFVQINTSDGQRFVFGAPDGNELNDRSENRIEWVTWTCTVGKNVVGIRPKYSEISDATVLDSCDGISVVGDSFGAVKLFRFPIFVPGAKFRRYFVHSSAITNVRFSFDGKNVVTTGGNDRAICLWKIVSDESYDQRIPDPTESPSDESDSESSDSSHVDSDIEYELRSSEIPNDKKIVRTNILEKKIRIKNKMDAPDVGLVVRFAFGYENRSDVVINRKGQVIFVTATLGVVLERDTMRQRFYQGHTNDLSCLCLHPKDDLVASAQISCIHIWSYDTLAPESIMAANNLVNFRCLDFSDDGTKLLSLGSDSSLIVWDWRKGSPLSSVKGNWRKIFAIKWLPNENTKFVTVGRKNLKFWEKIDVGFVCRRGRFDTTRRDTLLCVASGRSDTRFFVTGGTSGSIHIWQDGRLVRSIHSHSGPVFCIHSVNSGFVSCGKDGRICIWDEHIERCLRTYTISNENLTVGRLSYDRPPLRSCYLGHTKIVVGTKTGEIVQVDKDGSIRILLQSHSSNVVSGLCTHPTKDQAFTVGSDAFLRSWDLTNGISLMSYQLEYPASCVSISSDGLFLVVGFVNGRTTLFDLIGSSITPIYNIRHRNSTISDAKFSPNNKFLSVACREGFVDIYNVPKNRRVGVCDTNSDPIILIDWDMSSKFIRTQCKNGIFQYEIPQSRKISDANRIQWSTTNCFKTDQIRGIDRKSSATASDIAPNNDLLAVGHETGSLKLYRYPLSGKYTKYKKYRAHTKIGSIKWTHDGRHLVTTGANDGTIIVWQRTASDTRQFGFDSEYSDTDSDIEEGYDSDVDREKKFFVRKSDPEFEFPRKISLDVVIRPKSHDSPHRLHLEHVIGYNGHDCHNNVHYVNDGSDIVYNIGRIAVVLNLTSGIQSFYTDHQSEIVFVSVNPNVSDRGVVATGDTNSYIHIWHVLDLTTLSVVRLDPNKSVVSLGFSPNGKLLIVVEIGPNSVEVWDWRTANRIALSSDFAFRIFDAQFYPDSDRNFVSIGVKHIKFWRILGSEFRGNRGRYDNNRNPTFLSLAFGSNKIVLTGTTDGSIFVWRNEIVIRIVTHAHSGPIFTLRNSYDDDLIVSGAKESENRIKLWDPEMRRCKPFQLPSTYPIIVRSVCRNRSKILIGTNTNRIYEIDENTNDIRIVHESHGRGSVSLAIHPETRIFVSTGTDHTIRFWDLNSNRILANLNLPNIGSCIDWSSDGVFVAVGSSNGELSIYRWSTLDLIDRWRARSAELSIIKFSPDTSVLALGFGSGHVDLIRFKSPITRLFSVSFSTVFSIDFSLDSSLIRVSSTDGESRVVSLSTGRIIPSPSSAAWSTLTNPFVNEVSGIWPRKEGNCICSLQINRNKDLLASGDKLGRIKLFSYPCNDIYAKYNKFEAHCTPIKSICFTHDDQYILTSGSTDACIMIWRYES